ncbi:restriction endonuclease subunit S [Fusobacterium polymorphum]|uniref:restriction endonuclease subunit S n=1 Tax=Fusobacterium nucleatum subsp. polymorphum TaxID=76857 RepID=UPI0030D5260C
MAKNKKVEISLEEKLEKSLISVEEQPYKIPDNWVWTRLGNICEKISKGTTPRGEDGYTEEGVNFLRVENIGNNNSIDLSRVKYISKDTHNGFLKRSILKEKDILISIAGTLGRTAIVKKEDLPANINQAISFIRLVDNNNFLEKFIVFYLNSPIIKETLLGQVKVTAIPNLTLEIISDIKFSLPPLNEQKRIVEKLDFLFAKTKKAKEIIEEIKIDIENKKISILDRAFKGVLTSKWRNENKTSDVKELLKSINDEKNKKWEEDCLQAEKNGSKKPKKPIIREIEDMIVPVEEQPYKIPDSWVWVRLDNLCEVKGGKRIPKGEEFSNEKTKNVYLRVTDFDNYTINQDKLKYISDDLAEKLKNYKISIEDLYLSIAGTIGKVGIIPYELDKSFLTENAVKLTNLSNTINNKFLLNCFKTNFIQNLISNSITSSGQPKLAIFRIENFSIPLPPLEEQQEIVRILDEVLENENKVKELLELEEKIDILEKSILHKAFKGELGTQNNSDEPAIELLKNIL